MTITLKRLAAVLVLLLVGSLAFAACGDDDDDDDGGQSGTATLAPATGAPGSETPTIAPDQRTFCMGQAREDAIETLYESLKQSAEAQGLSVGDEAGLRNDSRAAIDHLCAAPTPFESGAFQVYCEDLQTAIENNIEGDEAAVQNFVAYYQAASCPSSTSAP